MGMACFLKSFNWRLLDSFVRRLCRSLQVLVYKSFLCWTLADKKMWVYLVLWEGCAEASRHTAEKPSFVTDWAGDPGKSIIERKRICSGCKGYIYRMLRCALDTVKHHALHSILVFVMCLCIWVAEQEQSPICLCIIWKHLHDSVTIRRWQQADNIRWLPCHVGKRLQQEPLRATLSALPKRVASAVPKIV